MLIARDLGVALDPALLGERVGLALTPGSVICLRERPKRCLLLASRQSGKSTSAALLAIYVAIYEAPALVLILSPSLRQSGEFFRSLMTMYARLDGAPSLEQESALRATLKNGSRLISLPGSERTVRGYAGASLLIVDEAARVDDELMTAIRPSMATVNGSLIALSTPAGRRGWFFEAWTGDDVSWHRVRVPANQCPRLSPEFLQNELRQLGPTAYAQEYALEFFDDERAMFASAMIDAAFRSEVRPLW